MCKLVLVHVLSRHQFLVHIKRVCVCVCVCVFWGTCVWLFVCDCFDELMSDDGDAEYLPVEWTCWRGHGPLTLTLTPPPPPLLSTFITFYRVSLSWSPLALIRSHGDRDGNWRVRHALGWPGLAGLARIWRPPAKSNHMPSHLPTTCVVGGRPCASSIFQR